MINAQQATLTIGPPLFLSFPSDQLRNSSIFRPLRSSILNPQSLNRSPLSTPPNPRSDLVRELRAASPRSIPANPKSSSGHLENILLAGCRIVSHVFGSHDCVVLAPLPDPRVSPPVFLFRPFSCQSSTFDKLPDHTQQPPI